MQNTHFDCGYYAAEQAVLSRLQERIKDYKHLGWETKANVLQDFLDELMDEGE